MTAFRTTDGCRLTFADIGEGLPVLWQHGLGADREQPAEVFPALPGIRQITLECRGHGGSDLGEAARLSIAQFAEDARGLLDHLGIERAIVGGISLGAALALRLAVIHPERVGGLILARPAWIDARGPERLRIYQDVAALLSAHGAERGLALFDALPRLAEVEAASPDNAASLRGFFTRRNPASTIALLSRIPADGPGIRRAQIAAVHVPTLVIGNDLDHVHPLPLARELAALIPQAAFREITPKATDRQQYVAEFRGALAEFLASRAAP